MKWTLSNWYAPKTFYLFQKVNLCAEFYWSDEPFFDGQYIQGSEFCRLGAHFSLLSGSALWHNRIQRRATIVDVTPRRYSLMTFWRMQCKGCQYLSVIFWEHRTPRWLVERRKGRIIIIHCDVLNENATQGWCGWGLNYSIYSSLCYYQLNNVKSANML